MSEITIEFANERHLPELSELFDAYREFFTHRLDLGASRAFIAERLRSGDATVFVATRDGKAHGFTQLYPLWSSWHCKRIWFLSDLYVKPAARKAGAGSLLIERVKEYGRETGASSVMVELPKREPDLYAFYDRLGFHADSIFDLARYYPQG